MYKMPKLHAVGIAKMKNVIVKNCFKEKKYLAKKITYPAIVKAKILTMIIVSIFFIKIPIQHIGLPSKLT